MNKNLFPHMKKSRWGISLIRQALLLLFAIGIATAAVPAFKMVVKTDNVNSESSANNQFTVPLNPNENYNFTVYWGDKTSSVITTATNPTHTYSKPGKYTVRIRENMIGGFPQIYFNNTGDRLKLLQISQWGGGTWKSMASAFWGCENMTITATDEETARTGNIIDFGYAWYNCSNLTSFPLLNTAKGKNFYVTWGGCSNLTSFPLLNTAQGMDFSLSWWNCSSLTSFPLLDTAQGTDFYGAWDGCSGLTSFPFINTAQGTDFTYTWGSCSRLTSFPRLNTAQGTNFSLAWYRCTGLTNFPLLDTAKGTFFDGAWFNCSSLTSFPRLNTAQGTYFGYAWYGCNSLTNFPLLNTAKGTNFENSWGGCSSLMSFPHLNTAQGTNFNFTWFGCGNLICFPRLNLGKMTEGQFCFYGVPLSEDSYSNLLIKTARLNTNAGVVFDGGFGQYNVSAASARNTLTSGRGWIITDGGPAAETAPPIPIANN